MVYRLIWLSAGCSFTWLVVQVVAEFELLGSDALIRLGDLVVAGLYLSVVRQARRSLENSGVAVVAARLDTWVPLLFGGLTLALIVMGHVAPDWNVAGAVALSAAGKALLVGLALHLRRRVQEALRASLRPQALHLAPAMTVLSSFAVAIAVGWLLLCLPEASATSELVGPLDALFTATSAVCVTGLIVKDTPRDFSLFGHLVILALIQTGGLGIMTLAAAFGVARGRKVSLRHQLVVQDTAIVDTGTDIGRTLREVLKYTLVIEAIGAIALFVRWWLAGEAAGRAAWLGVFHSISAFCNAGFSLFSNSLEDWVGDPVVNLTIGGLIIVGGLGFPVLVELRRWWLGRRQRQRVRLSLHARLVLVTTVWLLVVGFVGFLALEWTGVMLRLSAAESVWAALFQTITPRTAGFNTVPMGALTEASKFLLVLLMIVGASPGSTGGGIKTSTLAVIISLTRAMIYGGSGVHVFGRDIPEAVRHRAVGIVILYVASLLVVTFALAILERAPFIDLLFETASAFGTVGLSAGVTPTLRPLSRLLITAAMYLGRVGPLTVALAVSQRRHTVELRHPEEPVMVG